MLILYKITGNYISTKAKIYTKYGYFSLISEVFRAIFQEN